MLRSHTCGELNKSNADETVTLCGWTDRIRDLGGANFIDLRDRYGITQIVFAPEAGEALLKSAQKLRSEDVIKVIGTVQPRPLGQENPKLPTGEIEIRVTELEVLSKSEVPPFTPNQHELPNEDLRLKHRYIDLRRRDMMNTLMLRSKIIKSMRDYFDTHNFIDVETPILGRSTPEGARDYLVPSRVHNGSFYALPQSPQIYKQIMMIAGYDRYIQVARCFRDEDLRADRQPEFTQLDVEMSFIETEDILSLIDGLMAELAKEILDLDISLPLPRMTYDEAMKRFGHDAPDLRFGMEIVDVTELAKSCDFKVFSEPANSGKFVRGVNAPGAAANYSRRKIDELTEFVKGNFGAKGIVWFKVDEEGILTAPSAKNFSAEQLVQIGEAMDAKPGDLLLFLCDDWNVTCRGLYGLRKRFGAELKLYDPNAMHFSWIVEFPMFDRDEEGDRWNAMHHPFTAPRQEDLATLESDPSGARAQAYDLVINGFEAGGGTIRIHDGEVQSKVFSLLGMTKETARDRFGFLLDALSYGAPPHGGIALGIDRVVMLFAKLSNIRDCIAFPKTQKATDMMTEAPGDVDEAQLAELGITIVKPETEEV
ncbi:aspartate--tRNA ligase [Pirellulaceae bacterium]|nr:aspartate--tRNA ligase [Pirellulaceae bacterium]